MGLRTIFSLFLLAISTAFIFAAADTQPKIFAPGVISGPANDGTPTFTKDEKTLVFTRSGAGWSIIMESHKTGEQWSQPEIAKFSGEWLDMQPVFSPDGSYLIYVSTRPVPDAATHTSHLWRVDRIGNGWGEPKLLPDAINANPRIFKPSIAADGSLYFMTMDKGKKFRLVHSQFANGSYGQAESLPFSDGTTGDVDPEIAPDGSYLIFSSNGRTDGDTDHERMFIVFRSGDSWGAVTPIHYEGDTEWAASNDNEAHVSRDGKTLYFASDRTITIHIPLTREQSKQELERAQTWDDGNYNVWTLPIAPLLSSAHLAQRPS